MEAPAAMPVARFQTPSPRSRSYYEEGTFGAEFDPIPKLRQMGFTPTSGYRTQRHQLALVRQGLTNTRYGSYQRKDGLDLGVPGGMSKRQAIALVKRLYPGAKAIPSNGNSIHVTFPGWGNAPDISGSRPRYPEG